ncbi:cysteine hydrolase [Thalassospira sp. MA62]|nr:cysteine hydrolase [Thalassospira sp. MA62]
MWSMITFVIILLIALAVLAMYAKRHHLTPSTGAKINRSERPNTALLIIDLQEDFTTGTGKHTYAPDLVDRLIKAINDLVQTANANGTPVISIRQTFSGVLMKSLAKFVNKGRGNPKSNGLDLDDRINGDIDHDIVKSRADAFTEVELEKVLDRQKVGKLIIVGLDGDYCVNATMQAALNRGYDVSFSDATTLALNTGTWKKTKARLSAQGAHGAIHQDAPHVEHDENANEDDVQTSDEKSRETA